MSVARQDHAAGLVPIPGWEHLPGIKAAFTSRAGGASLCYQTGHSNGAGELNLGFTREDSRDAVLANRSAALEALGAGPRLCAVRQVHGTGIALIGHADVASDPPEADGLITHLSGVVLGIQVADCVPVLVADPVQRVVGAFHAGWRGTVASITARGVLAMVEQYGCRPERMLAAIGPSVGVCCYEIGQEVQSRFRQSFSYAEDLFAGRHLDLWKANRLQLLAAGLPAAAITVLGECTACTRERSGERRYFSYRAEQGVTGRAMGLIGLL